jgi:dUTP pyrophosphatase
MTERPATDPEFQTDASARVRVRVLRLPHGAHQPLPAYETEGAAGMDVRAALEAPVDIAAGAIERVPTGFAIEVPAGYEVQLRPRSGLAARHGVTLVNSPATIDSDYRGEVFVALINHGAAPFRVEPGMRIAQLVLARVPRIAWDLAGDLSPTARGGGGFGHTGTT